MTDGLSARLAEIRQNVADAVGPATFKAMEHLHTVAVSKTPLGETGNLRGESSVEEIPNGARVYYPGPYARYQHYELQLRHTVGQALYLEQPLVQEHEAIMEILSEAMRAAIE